MSKSKTSGTTKKKEKDKKKTKAGPLRLFVYVLVFVIAWLPLLLPLLGTQGVVNSEFSSYNTQWNGCSEFKSNLESDGYTTKSVVATLSTTNKQIDPGVLLIVGPSVGYGLFDISALMGYVLAGGSVLIADDFGSANLLFDSINDIIGGAIGFSIEFAPGVLHDFGSYHRNPVLPLITTFSPHPTTTGINEVLLNYASAINITVGGQSIMDMMSVDGNGEGQLISKQNGSQIDPSGLVGLLGLTTPFSWLDQNGNGLPDPENETAGPFVVGLALDFAPLSSMLMLNTTAGRIVLFSDPSIFVNEMIGEYDNTQFTGQIVDWLAHSNTSKVVSFDEAHLQWDITSAVVYFGLILGQVLQFSGNWLIAPFAPLALFFLVKRWLPKASELPEYSTTEVFRRKGKTKYAKELEVLRKYETFNKALKVLYDKWRRELVSILRLKGWSGLDDIFMIIETQRPDLDLKQVKKVMYFCETSNKKVKKDKFIDIFLTMKGFLSNLQGEGLPVSISGDIENE
ncbi:MAG: DUF4350 domain-containing protein [Candidatus Ranarchaeia archaeon]